MGRHAGMLPPPDTLKILNDSLCHCVSDELPHTGTLCRSAGAGVIMLSDLATMNSP